MLPNEILQSSLLDILFENRNKNYGAYNLRKSYNKRVGISMLFMIMIAALFSAITLSHKKEIQSFTHPPIIPPDTHLIEVVTKPEEPRPPQAKRSSTSNANSAIFSKPVIDDEVTSSETPTTDVLDEKIVSYKNNFGNGDIDIVQPPASNGNSNVGKTEVIEEKPDDTPLFNSEVMPRFPGGLDALRKFMLKNLRQPSNMEPGETIIVKAFFVVNRSGEIEQVKITNNGREDLNKEVLRVIRKMPKWKPGIQNGKTVAVYFNLPVTFTSEE